MLAESFTQSRDGLTYEFVIRKGARFRQILHDRVTHIPIYELAFMWGVGPRVEEPGINLIRGFAYSEPLEDVKLKRP